jgi:hypothetical protein
VTPSGKRGALLKQSTGNARNSNALKMTIARKRSGGDSSKRIVGTRNNAKRNSAGETKKLVGARTVHSPN